MVQEEEARGAMSDGETNGYDDATPLAEPKSVRWAEAEAPPSPGGAESATVLYDFDAQGDDELTVKEHEMVTVVDKENDEWWSVRNSAGAEGVVPAQYVQLNDGSQPAPEPEDDAEDEARRAEEEAAAAAALEAERKREARAKAEQKRAIESAAKERAQQEEADRAYALEVEAKEAARAEKRARKAEHEQRAQRERDAAKR